MEWIDKPTQEEEIQITLDLKQKEIELGYNGTDQFPLLEYGEL